MRRRSKDGLQVRCRMCNAASENTWRKSHPERCRAACRRWAAKNPDWNRKWYAANRTKKLIASAKYARTPKRRASLARYQKSPEGKAAVKRYLASPLGKETAARKVARYRDRHRDAVRAEMRARQKTPHGRAMSARLSAKRRSVALLATPRWANKARIAEFYSEAERLTRETGISHHVDHIWPLHGRRFTGLHVESNLQVLTAIENIRKGNRVPH